jgi:hypothetical protein
MSCPRKVYTGLLQRNALIVTEPSEDRYIPTTEENREEVRACAVTTGITGEEN